MSPEELRARRLALGMSQKDLADILDVTKDTVSRWERGVLAIKRHTILLHALVYLDWLRMMGHRSR